MSGFSGQGKVYLGKRLPSGLPGAMRWIGNATALKLSLDEEVSETNESFSGQRLPYRRSVKTRSGGVAISFDEFSKENLSLMLAAAVTTVAAGVAVVDRVLATPVLVGEALLLGAYNVSQVTITDSSVAPKTLTANVNYRLNEFAGTVDIIDLTVGGPFVMPLKASYTPGTVVQVGAFKEASPEYYMRLDGVNTDDGSRMVADVFRVRLSPTKTLDLINEDLSTFELEGSVLADATRASETPGGQFFSLTLPTI